MTYESCIQELIRLTQATLEELDVLNIDCQRSVAVSESNIRFGPYDTPLKIRVIRRSGRCRISPTIIICIPEDIVEDYCAASENERNTVNQNLITFIAKNYKFMINNSSPSSSEIIYWVYE